MRIVVVGTSGAGKTTLARRIAALLELPHIELDAINWQPGWRDLTRRGPAARLRPKTVRGETPRALCRPPEVLSLRCKTATMAARQPPEIGGTASNAGEPLQDTVGNALSPGFARRFLGG
jgi:energy-coupling factor transporter ATP-binding protein EcfA2